MNQEQVPMFQANAKQLLQDMLEVGDPDSHLILTLTKELEFRVSDEFWGIVGTGETLEEALIDFQLSFWVSLSSAPGSYGLHSGTIDWTEGYYD
jgi:hypothetical protein